MYSFNLALERGTSLLKATSERYTFEERGMLPTLPKKTRKILDLYFARNRGGSPLYPQLNLSVEFQKKAHIHKFITQALINLNILYKTVGAAEMAPSFPFDVLANGFIWK